MAGVVQRFDQGTGLAVGLDVQPLVRNAVGGEEVLGLVAGRRPEGARDSDAVVRQRHGCEPVAKQVVQDGIEVLLGRVPGLHQVVIESDRVDAVDRRLGVCVGREQRFAGFGVDLPGLVQELGAAHPRHPLVGQEQRHRRVAPLEQPHRIERFGARAGLHDPVFAAVVLPEVSLDGVQHLRLVVYDQDDGSGHARQKPPLVPAARSTVPRRWLAESFGTDLPTQGGGAASPWESLSHTRRHKSTRGLRL